MRPQMTRSALMYNTAGWLAAAFLQGSFPARAQQPSSIAEYTVSTASGGPDNIVSGPDGNLWFTEVSANRIGRITTSGSITEYQLQNGAAPAGITSGPDGALWFTESGGNRIGRITTEGAVREFSVPSPGGNPMGIAAGPDSALWFTEMSTGKIGRVTPQGAIFEYTTPTAGSAPVGITTGPDGAMWFTESGAGRIGRITTGGVIGEHPVPTPGSQPYGIVTGPDGALWFTENGASQIGRMNLTGVVFEYRTPTASSHPVGITSGSDGALWFTEQSGNNIGRITSAGIITEYNVPTSSSGPAGITAGLDGRVWFAERSGNKIGARTTTSGALAPAIKAGGVVTLYSSSTTVQPGSFVSIFGTNLATMNASWNGNFPTSLGGTSVTVNGKPAYLWYVSPGQINMQAPDDMSRGSVNVAVTTPRGSGGAVVTLGSFSPSFSRLDGTHVAGIIVRADGSYDILGPTGTSLGYPTVAARPGDAVELFGVGFGPTEPSVPAGQPFSGAAPTTSPVKLLINGVSVTAAFAGLVEAGLYQINVIIPTGLATGDIPLQALVGGVETPAGVVISLE